MGQQPRRANVALDPATQAAVAAAFRAARLRSGLTQKTVASRADVSIDLVRRLEAGEANPTLATLYAVARALSVRLPDLLPD